MTNEALAKRYAPVICFDQNETIPLAAVGYSVLRDTAKSPSFSRIIPINDAAFVIEYAYYWDYDIQHMYDLEHIWVWVGQDGHICDAQASFHGRYLSALLKTEKNKSIVHEDRIQLYCQPGKHAFLPHGEWFELLPDYMECCMEKAGGGLLINDLFAGKFETNEALDKRIDSYIKSHLAFRPSMRFVPTQINESLYHPWEEVEALISIRINNEIGRILTI